MFLSSPTEKSASLVEQVSQSADQAIQSSQQAANDALESLTVAMQDLRHQVTPMLDRASEQMASLKHRSMDGLRETSHQLRVKAEHASESTTNYIKHEPVKSVLIAAATGADLMALVSLISRSQHRN